ncbi:hypothetical protein P154DRAFT_580700 [Amniculicola lignicola CBS 123094]|uniref:Azaphilone pigments biosynthesis cluster protein L N-terminal domain-containing protein n=1 Tax=Amniculicola lignicola CBS 123094 TaxID=1392246 RepID=A0A6A5W3Y0_9PLEO|nr:hypothetical protein P154DRAFT_580700 [Amniculicola lignicola CBS 123094]
MADPLSVAASVVTLVSVCTAISKRTVTFIRSLREAPEELIQLSNEISDLTTILNQMKKVLVQSNTAQIIPSGSTQTRVLPSSAASPTAKAELLIVEVDNFIKSLKKTSSKKGGTEVDRLGWARKRRIALDLQQRLAVTRQSIQLQLTTNTASCVRQIETVLNNSSTSAEQGRKIYESKIDYIHERITRYESGGSQSASTAIHSAGHEQIANTPTSDTATSIASVEHMASLATPSSKRYWAPVPSLQRTEVIATCMQFN